MPELQQSLESYQGGLNGADSRGNLVASLRDLFANLSKASDGFPPLVFWQMLRQSFPQFSQTGQGGIPMQQDAEECWSELVSVLKAKLPHSEDKNFIERYMTGELEAVTECVDAPEEEKTRTVDSFTKLSCHISINTNYMINGILESLTEEIEKNSPTLNRTAKYRRKHQVSRLPQYLPIQFIRFFWKPQERVRAKILRKVKFPLDFDATELCTPELQSKFSKAKLKMKEIEDKKVQKAREEKRRKLDGENDGNQSNNMDTLSEEKVDWKEYLDPKLLEDVGCNPTGQYELCAVLTHVGRSADSGHYIAWVKKNTDEWHKFDDDKVSVLHDADIERLDGGGDWHTAYIVLYRAKKLE
jgi:ubiquitin carboxyl-terminal hydrolase 14